MKKLTILKPKKPYPRKIKVVRIDSLKIGDMVQFAGMGNKITEDNYDEVASHYVKGIISGIEYGRVRVLRFDENLNFEKETTFNNDTLVVPFNVDIRLTPKLA